ncbi:MAG: RidA family protein [Acidimicrobiia bacterium]
MEKIVVEGLARLPSFSHAVVAGDTIYVSGSLGTLPNSMELISGGAGPETTQTLSNIEAILHASGASLDDVVKVNVYVSDMAAFNEMNSAYLEAFGDSPPARITVGGVDLALDAAVEIDCIAHKPA